MFFKLIQKRELAKIIVAIESDDKEMRKYATKALRKRQIVRFSFTTILLFHLFLVNISITGILFLNDHYKLKFYLVPLVIFAACHVIWTLLFLISSFETRTKYDPKLDKIDDWLGITND